MKVVYIIFLITLFSLHSYGQVNLVVALEQSVIGSSLGELKNALKSIRKLDIDELSNTKKGWMGPYWTRFQKSLSSDNESLRLAVVITAQEHFELKKKIIEEIQSKWKREIHIYSGIESSLAHAQEAVLRGDDFYKLVFHDYDTYLTSLLEMKRRLENNNWVSSNHASNFVFTLTGQESIGVLGEIPSHSVIFSSEDFHIRPLNSLDVIAINKAFGVVNRETGEPCVGKINKILQSY